MSRNGNKVAEKNRVFISGDDVRKLLHGSSSPRLIGMLLYVYVCMYIRYPLTSSDSLSVKFQQVEAGRTRRPATAELE